MSDSAEDDAHAVQSEAAPVADGTSTHEQASEEEVHDAHDADDGTTPNSIDVDTVQQGESQDTQTDVHDHVADDTDAHDSVQENTAAAEHASDEVTTHEQAVGDNTAEQQVIMAYGVSE